MGSTKAMFWTLYARITYSRITLAFFLFSFVHCFAQGIIHSFLFHIDGAYTTLLSDITDAAGIPSKNITWLQGDLGNMHLQLCDDIPYYLDPVPCFDVFRSTVDIDSPPDDWDLRQTIVGENLQHGFNIAAMQDTTNTTIINGVRLIGRDGTSVILGQQCAGILVYPRTILNDLRREDLTLVSLQFWLFIVSIFTIMNDSVPHTLTVLSARALMSGWSMFALWREGYYEAKFDELVNTPGSPCSMNMFPEYFQTRKAYEIPDLILSLTALVIASYLSFTLLRVYNAQSFKCVGAPRHIMRIHKFFMAVLACLQLEVFVLVTAMVLWLDVLLNTAIKELSEHTPEYKAVSIITSVLLIPWLITGWYAIRREMKRMVALFLSIAFILIFGWSIMFYSLVYRWTFVEWPLMACFSVASFILLIASAVLAIICRVNFGKGLAQYIEAEESLASINFAPEVFPHDIEKGPIDWESQEKPRETGLPIPTYLEAPTLYLSSADKGDDDGPVPVSSSPPREFEPVRRPPPTSS